MDRFEGFGKSTPLNPRLRNRWVYKRSSWQRKANYNCGLYYRRWTGTWSSLDIFYTNIVKEGDDFSPDESAVADEKVREMQKIQKQNDRMEENLQASASTKNKRKEKSSHQLFVNKSKKDDEVEVEDEKHEEEAGILEDFDYHDNINAESYEKYFESVCKLLKTKDVIIIDNASYHSRNADDFPVSKWKKSQFQDWLKDHKIPFRPDALRTELWMLCKIYRATNTSKVIDNIAKRYGHEVLRLPPYHCDLNAVELIWADEKNFVARENEEMTLESVEKLFRKRRAEITAEMCKKCEEHVEPVELSYWKTDRIIDLKMDQLEISLDANEEESDIELHSDQHDL